MDNRLYIDMDWGEDLQVGEFLVISVIGIKLTTIDINNDILQRDM